MVRILTMTSPRDHDVHQETVETNVTMMTRATKDLRVSRETLEIRGIREIIAIHETREATEIVTNATPTTTRHAAAAETIMMKKDHVDAGRRWNTGLIPSLCGGTTANDDHRQAEDGETTIILTKRVITTIVDLTDPDARPHRLDERVDMMTTTKATMMTVAMGEADEMEIATRTNLPRKSRLATTSELKSISKRK
jgi:hypothetical protein